MKIEHSFYGTFSLFPLLYLPVPGLVLQVIESLGAVFGHVGDGFHFVGAGIQLLLGFAEGLQGLFDVGIGMGGGGESKPIMIG